MEMRNSLPALRLAFGTGRAAPACAPWIFPSPLLLQYLCTQRECAWQQTLSRFYGYVRVTWQYRTYGRKPSLSLSLCNLWHRRGAALAGPGCGARARPAASAPGSLRGFRSNKQVTEEVHEVKRTTNELPFDKCPRVCAPARRSGTFCCYETN